MAQIRQTFSLDELEFEQFKKLAQKRDSSMSREIRNLIRQELKKEEEKCK